MKFAFFQCMSVVLYICLLWTTLNQLQIYLLPEHHGEILRISRSNFTSGWEYSTPFPVDVVYTWINGCDPNVLEDLKRLKDIQRNDPSYMTDFSNIEFNRFADNGALRFSLRSLEKNANWIRHVFIVTNGQVPDWLDISNPRVTIVKHQVTMANRWCVLLFPIALFFMSFPRDTYSKKRLNILYYADEDIFDEPENLPTFSSCAIEHNIHKIKGLSEMFLYLNDDILFGRKVSLDDFYTDNKITKIHLAWHADTMCDTECHAKQIQNGFCEEACNQIHCAWDGGDCDSVSMEMRPKDSGKEYFKYKTSVFYTNAIYSRAFGYKRRRVVAHVPLFMEKKLKKEMDKRFSKEVNETIRHKLRAPLDLQFQFSYVHFLMEEYRHLRRFDVKVLSPDVTFVSITNNLTKTRTDLDMIWETKSKFICINDDMDYKQTEYVKRVKDLVRKYYIMMFPTPSSVELPN